MKLRRPSGSLVASIAVHAVVGALFVQALVLERPLIDVFGRMKHTAPPIAEHIGFVQLPSAAPNAKPVAGRSGGDARSTHATASPRLVAPRVVPTEIEPPSPSSKPTTEEPSSGPLVGGGGPLRGVQPHYADPRLWGAPGEIAAAPKTSAERLDSVITADITAHNDSIRVAAGAAGRKPGDWTFEHNGQKYGIDSKYIRLGPVSIPTAVLALLPLNVSANPTVTDRERTLSARHDEIFAQAQRGINDADFQKAVREIRERKERERREAEAEKQKATQGAASTSNESPN